MVQMKMNQIHTHQKAKWQHSGDGKTNPHVLWGCADDGAMARARAALVNRVKEASGN